MTNKAFVKGFLNLQYSSQVEKKGQDHLIHDLILDPYSYLIDGSQMQQNPDGLNPSQLQLRHDLNQLKFHVARINNIPVQIVLPSRVLTAILENSKLSVFQIFSLYEDFGNPPLGLELCKRIYDVIQLSQEKFQDYIRIHPKELSKQISQKSGADSLDIKQVLKDIDWSDDSSWLNSSYDQSMFLYKKIICIDEIDESVGGDYLKMIKGQAIRKQDLGVYVRYAKFLRNKNFSQLEYLYKQNLKRKQSSQQNDFYEQIDLPIQQQQKPMPQKISKQITQQDQSDNTKSCTSLDQNIIQKNVQDSCHRIWSTLLKNQTSNQIHNFEQSEQLSEGQRSSNQDSINISEIDEGQIRRWDIRPLPNSIQEIYQLAQNVKKNVQAKSTKKKQKKGKNDSDKDVGFIPTQAHINNLIKSLYYFH